MSINLSNYTMSCPFSIEDIQSWWEVPSIAHFCSLFRATFNLLDFDIEELEEALLNDGTEECASSLLTELIVRLLQGCLRNNDISAFNYQMFLRRLFRQKCQEKNIHNPFNDDIDFQFLPLRTKVEILYALCDFRLDSEDVFDLFKNLEAESLRVEPLGWDSNWSAYWYFYGTRLYREDFKDAVKGRKLKKHEELKFRKCSEILRTSSDKHRVWQVVCFTEADWIQLTEKFKWSTSGMEKKLYQSLSENFLPEIPRLFQEKLRLQRKRLLESMPRRQSSRVQTLKTKTKEEESTDKQSDDEIEIKNKSHRDSSRNARSSRPYTPSSLSEDSNVDQSGSAMSSRDFRASARALRDRLKEVTPDPPKVEKKQTKPTGRRTNNSLASATGQIVIPDIQERGESTRKKLKTSQIFAQSEEDVQTDMYKVLQQLKAHEDSWPFMDPVEEEYAPNYYTVIRRPMDLGKIEERLDQGYYTNLAMFKLDFNLIVNNCRLYNGQDNEYTEMVDNLQIAFSKLTRRYFDCPSSSEEEIVVEYPPQCPLIKKYSKSEKRSSREDLSKSERNKRKRSSSRESNPEESEAETLGRCSVSSKQSIHSLGKHSKTQDDDRDFFSDLSEDEPEPPQPKKVKKTHSGKEKKKKLKSYKKSRKHKYLDKKSRKKHGADGKKKKSRKSSDSRDIDGNKISRKSKKESSSSKKLPKEPEEVDSDFYKDKFDKIKERRRQNAKPATNDKKSSVDKPKSNLSQPEKEKNSNLKETIEKLKAKSEKRGDLLFDELLSSNSNQSSYDKKSYESNINFNAEKSSKHSKDEYDFIEESNKSKDKKKTSNKSSAVKKATRNDKNESASEALEQAVKDISKWLDDTPKLSEFDSDTNSPLQVNTDDFPSISKLDEEISGLHFDRDKAVRKDALKKRTIQKEVPKVVRRKEIQRTIERLQPGKSKGNLISNMQTNTKQEESVSVISSIAIKAKETKNVLLSKPDEGSPKLSLGTVLPTVRFGLGQHEFNNEQNAVKVEVVDTGTMTCEAEENIPIKPVETEETVKTTTALPEDTEKVPVEKPVKPATPIITKGQEKATPNLSAWFKAFGAPKSGAQSKKKAEEVDQEESKSNENQAEAKNPSPNDSSLKTELVTSEEPFANDGGESPTPSHLRQRRTSTGSSVSERSSFSQDLDSPRHQASHPSPLLRSPASPRTEDHQKQYPLMNVTVRVGFYQDTTSVKSSPEKSCSPREAPQSPYPTYPQHVYAGSGNNTIAQTPAHTYSEQEKSPLMPYSQPNYYDTAKTPSTSSKDFSSYSSENVYQQPVSSFSGPYSPAQQSHSQHSPYSQVQNSPSTYCPSTVSSLPQTVDSRPHDKTSMFPVKKRTYSESCQVIESVEQSKRDIISERMIEKNENATSVIQDTNAVNSSFSANYPHIAKNDEQLRNLALSKYPLSDSKSAIVSNVNDISSNEYLSRKSPFDFSSSSLSKAYYGDNTSVVSSSAMSKRSYNTSEFESPVNMVNMGYSSKNYEASRKTANVDLVNMGYSDPIETKPLTKNNEKSSISNLISKAHKHYDMYATATNARNDMSALQDYSKASVDNQLMLNQKYYDKINPYYQNMSADLSRYSSESALQSMAKAQNMYSESLVRHPAPYGFNDWKSSADLTKKVSEVHNLSMSQTKIETSDMVSTTSKAIAEQSVTESVEDASKASNSELRIPIIRAVIEISSSIKPENQQQPALPDYNSRMRNINVPSSTARSSESIYGHNLTTSSGMMGSNNTYKSLHGHSSLPNDTSMRNLGVYPPVMDRLKDERLLSSYSTPDKSYYDKSLHLAYSNKIHSSLHSANPSSSMYPVSSMSGPYARDSPYGQSMAIESGMPEPEKKPRSKKKKTESAMQPSQSFHGYAGMKSSQQPVSESSPISLKTSNIVPGSAFNFGPPGSLSSSLFGESSAFLEEFRNSSTNQYMAANYIAAAAAAAHQRNTPESVDKHVKPAHQSSVPQSTSNPFPFLGHSQARPGYSPLLGLDPSSTIYQQYLQRHQEELLRHSSSQMMGLFSQGYPGSLSGRQPFDSINRHSWL